MNWRVMTDACIRANKLLVTKLNKALDALERSDGPALDQALEEMVKIRKSMELGGCSLKKPIGFEWSSS